MRRSKAGRNAALMRQSQLEEIGRAPGWNHANLNALDHFLVCALNAEAVHQTENEPTTNRP
jgi:hypothetical protein